MAYGRISAALIAVVLVFGMQSDAQQPSGPVPAVPRVFDYSELYRSLNPSIVKVYADAGHGSGFLVSADGLIATNHHVVRNARWIAVEFSDGPRVLAEVALLNPRFDIAILKVNRVVVGSRVALRILPAERDAEVKAGIPVAAFGSPLSQTFLMTQGVIAKVEDHALLGDFLLEQGNSGGPLVNLDGEVIGINTFGVKQISGAVRVGVLRDSIAQVQSSPVAVTEPPAESLPKLSKDRYPTDALKKKVLGEKLDTRVYEHDGGKFVVTVVTPVVLAKASVQDAMQRAANRYSRRGKKIRDASYEPVDEPFYEWHRTAIGELDYAVTIEIRPDFGMTTGSKVGLIFAAMGGQQAAQNFHANMEFKAEFADFKLYRDGQLVTPVLPGRGIRDASFSGPQFTFVDEAYSGLYQYAPEDFMTGKEFRMEILDAREPEKIHKVLTFRSDSKLIQAIRADFTF